VSPTSLSTVGKRALDLPGIQPFAQASENDQRRLILLVCQIPFAHGRKELAVHVERLGPRIGIGHRARQGEGFVERGCRFIPAPTTDIEQRPYAQGVEQRDLMLLAAAAIQGLGRHRFRLTEIARLQVRPGEKRQQRRRVDALSTLWRPKEGIEPTERSVSAPGKQISLGEASLHRSQQSRGQTAPRQGERLFEVAAPTLVLAPRTQELSQTEEGVAGGTPTHLRGRDWLGHLATVFEVTVCTLPIADVEGMEAKPITCVRYVERITYELSQFARTLHMEEKPIKPSKAGVGLAEVDQHPPKGIGVSPFFYGWKRRLQWGKALGEVAQHEQGGMVQGLRPSHHLAISPQRTRHLRGSLRCAGLLTIPGGRPIEHHQPGVYGYRAG
jgi:hypothetical protein